MSLTVKIGAQDKHFLYSVQTFCKKTSLLFNKCAKKAKIYQNFDISPLKMG